MAMENNRTWVEKGNYSVPADERPRLVPLKVKGVLFLLVYFILTELALNLFITRHFRGGTLTISPLWGWRSFVGLNMYYGVATPVLMKISAMLAFTFLASAVLFRVLFFDKIESDKEKLAVLHGSSHWATREEIIQAGLMLPDGEKPKKIGVTLGGWKDPKGFVHYLRHSGPEHILVVAPTRSGKGISVVVPTLLSWDSSLIVLDIKGENWLLSAGWRERHIGPCLRFEPTDENSPCRYNPLKEIALGTTDETRDIQNIASMICDPDGKGLDDHWISNAFTLLTGAITHECYCAKNEDREPSMVKVRAAIAGGNIQQSLCEWRDTKHVDGKTHPTVESVALEMLQKADKEVSSIYSTAITKLSLWLDPVVAKNTTESTFRISDLVNYEKPVSLYVVVPPSDLNRLRPILRLMVTQIIFGLTKRMEVDKEKGGVTSGHKHQLLMLLDEAARLEKLDALQDGLSYFGGYGLKACIIFQSYKQPMDIYGKDETVTANCKVHIVYAPNEEEDAKLISEKCGRTTVTVGSSNISGKRFAIGPFGKSSESISYSQQARELLLPDEVKRLRGPKKDAEGRVLEAGDVLIFSAGTAPIYGVQTPFFLDPIIGARSKIKPPENITSLQPQHEHPKEENIDEELCRITDGIEETPVSDGAAAQALTEVPAETPIDEDKEIMNGEAVLLSFTAKEDATPVEEAGTPFPDELPVDEAAMPYGEEDIEALDGTDNFEDDELKDIPSPILDLLYPLEAPSASEDNANAPKN